MTSSFPKLPNPYILAPMAGITDDVFRLLCFEQGAAMAYSEMVSAKALHYGDTKSLELLRHTREAQPVAFQLFGSDPEIMAEAVQKLDALDSEDFSCASYDINMGCPVSKVVKNGEGSALMRDPERATHIVEAMVRVTSKPVTVKIRAGWDEDSVNAISFARAMERAGAAAIAVHGRTREQYYNGKSDWSIVALVKESVNVPVIGSGDIMSAADAALMIAETGCDYVMIARGALGNPWIFREALHEGDSPTPAERVSTFKRHALMLANVKGEYIAVREMRKHAGWYFKGLPGVTSLRARVNQVGKLDDLIDTIDHFGAV